MMPEKIECPQCRGSVEPADGKCPLCGYPLASPPAAQAAAPAGQDDALFGVCQACGLEAPTRHASFRQNIGAIVMRWERSVEGELCRNCVTKHFWQLTLTTFFLGWWGLISLIVTPIYLVINVVNYVKCLGLAPVPPGAVPPALDDAALARLKPQAERVLGLMSGTAPFPRVAREVARETGVTPGQAWLFMRLLAQSIQEAQGKGTAKD